MANRIPFLVELKASVGPILAQAGFYLLREDNRIPEYVAYERKTSVTPRNDQVHFHGDEHQSNIRAYAVSGKKHVDLTTLKLLLPDFASLDIHEQDGWQYETEHDLKRCVVEITELVEEKLLNWFESPFMPEPGKSTINLKAIMPNIADTIRQHEQMAKKFRAEGRISEARRHEFSAEQLRKHLNE